LRKIILLNLFAVLICGCFKIYFSPPEISQENVRFENKYFSIDYPKGWKAEQFSFGPDSFNFAEMPGMSFPTRGGSLNYNFEDPAFKRYYIAILISGATSSVDSLPQDFLELITDEVVKQDVIFFKNKNHDILSRSISAFDFKGNRAKQGVITTEKFSRFNIFIQTQTNFYIIRYELWNDYDENIRERIKAIVHSLEVQ